MILKVIVNGTSWAGVAVSPLSARGQNQTQPQSKVIARKVEGADSLLFNRVGAVDIGKRSTDSPKVDIIHAKFPPDDKR